jgi:hypothetical protein
VFLFCFVLALSSSPTSGDEEVRYQYMECSEPVNVGAPQKKMIMYYLVAGLALCGGKEDIACTPDKVSDYAPLMCKFWHDRILYCYLSCKEAHNLHDDCGFFAGTTK